MTEQPMTDEEFRRQLGILAGAQRNYGDIASVILALIKEAGYVRLAEDQTPPENPASPLKSGLEQAAWNGFELAKLKHRDWRRVIL